MTRYNENLKQKVGRLTTAERNRLQKKYLRLITDPEVKSKTDIASALGVSHDTIDRWEVNSGFKIRKAAYLRERHITERDLRNLEVYNSMHKQATDPKKPIIYAAKLSMERHDPEYQAKEFRRLSVNIFDLGGTIDKLKIQEDLEKIDRALSALRPAQPKMIIDVEAQISEGSKLNLVERAAPAVEVQILPSLHKKENEK